MSINIFQSYYREDQITELSPEFIPYDNRANPVKNLYELYLYRRIYDLADQSGVWGMFSWQWRRKLSGISAQGVLDVIQGNPGADVYLFNAYPWDESRYFNIWEQGEQSHPGILHLAQAVLATMGEDPNLVKQPMCRDTYLAANYFAGNKYFWDGLLEFLTRFESSLDQLSPEDQTLLRSSAGYEPNPNLDFTGFLCERMISTYLLKKQDELDVCAYVPPGNFASEFKYAAVEKRDADALRYWNQMRESADKGLVTQWIEELYS